MTNQKEDTLKTVLRRFTNLTSLIHILQTQKITLLNPASWDDKNDAHFMAEYKRKIGAQTVLALCFTESKERFHHWKVFASGPDGVAVDIHRTSLVKKLRKVKGVEFRQVDYKLVDELKNLSGISAQELPFIKREPYTHEMEHRAVYVSKIDVKDSLDIEIDLSWIKRITLSPWMPISQKESVVETLRGIQGCHKMTIVRSSLIENSTWREIATNAK